MLRGIAALIVVISHYSNHSHILEGRLGAGAGQFGVMLFFMLSGFLMSLLYLRQPLDGTALKRYAAARIARVVPLFIAVVLASWLLLALGAGALLYPIANLKSALSHLLLLRGVSVLWTIPPELQFYVLFAGFWWLFRRSAMAFYLLLVLGFAGLTLLDFPRPTGQLLGLRYDFSLPQTASYFALGMVFGNLYGRLRVPVALVRQANVLVLLAIPLLYPQVFLLLTGSSHDLWQDPRILLAMGLVFFVLVFLVPADNPLLCNRPGDFLGRVSYSLYLLHLPVLLAIKPWIVSRPWAGLVIFLTLSLGLAYLSFRVFEQPSRRYLRRRLGAES